MVTKSLMLVPAAALALAACGSDTAGTATSAPTTTSTQRTAEPTSAPPTAADGTNLEACLDGACEVEVKLGDVIPFGRHIEATPPLTTLTVIAMDADGPMLSDPSGFASTIRGSVTMNDAISIETLYADGTRALLRISLAGP